MGRDPAITAMAARFAMFGINRKAVTDCRLLNFIRLIHDSLLNTGIRNLSDAAGHETIRMFLNSVDSPYTKPQMVFGTE
jgi:hypothetical protein